jgi:hypothetical protein
MGSARIAKKYHLSAFYAFGSREKEVAELIGHESEQP